MKISQMLQAIASWLESPDNEAMMLAEYDDACLQVVATSCLTAAAELKKAAEQVNQLEPAAPSTLTPEALDDLANIAAAFDSSDNPDLKKQASVIDELLLTIAASPDALSSRQSLIDAEIDGAKKKFQEPKPKYNPDDKKIADAKEAIEESGMTKNYRVLEAPLSGRGCPDHAGTPIARVGENSWQCPLDGKIYNFELGFELENGDKVPGSSVANQSLLDDRPQFAAFETRQSRLNRA